MQFLYSALSSNELKALYVLLPSTAVHTNTSAPQRSIQPGYTLQGATDDQCTIAFSVYCQVLIYGSVNRSTFRVQILPNDSRYWTLSVRRDSNPRSRDWESNALTTRPTVPQSSLDSISTLTASFALQDQHPLPIALRPHSSIPSPSLSHAMFRVWSPNIFSLWHPNPRLPSLLSLCRFTPMLPSPEMLLADFPANH